MANTMALESNRPVEASAWRRMFVGPQGLRAGWALAVFLVVENLLEIATVEVATKGFGVQPPRAWSPTFLIVGELIELALALIATLLMARIERRDLATYGLPLRRAFRSRFWEGALWGVVSAGLVYALMAAAGGYRVDGLAQQGTAALTWMLLWALAFLSVALYEELYFRGYTLFTLARGMGFWPGALLLSLAFGALHYFQKPNETVLDFVNVTLVGVLFCFMVRRTGDVWLAVGWHFTFNFVSMGIMGSPNTGNDGGKPLVGHLLASTFHGADWLTGGVTGAEASVLTTMVFVALFALLQWRHPTARYPAAAASAR